MMWEKFTPRYQADGRNHILVSLMAKTHAIALCCINLHQKRKYPYSDIYFGLLRELSANNIFVDRTILNITSLKDFTKSLSAFA